MNNRSLFILRWVEISYLFRKDFISFSKRFPQIWPYLSRVHHPAPCWGQVPVPPFDPPPWQPGHDTEMWIKMIKGAEGWWKMQKARWVSCKSCSNQFKIVRNRSDCTVHCTDLYSVGWTVLYCSTWKGMKKWWDVDPLTNALLQKTSYDATMAAVPCC